MNESLPPTIDPTAAARWQRRPNLIEGRVASAWLHEEVARRMEERLAWIVRRPQSWLHWEPLRGGLQVHELLARRYPGVPVELRVAVPQEAAVARHMTAGPWWKRWIPGMRPRSDVTAGKAAGAQTVDLLWANMGLHMAADPLALIREWHSTLAVDGMLMFSCFGPDTLRELRDLYAALGWQPPAHEYTDMHDWGDMLVGAGFAEPVMDMERIELTFETPERLLQELRGLGRNLHPARSGRAGEAGAAGATGLRGRGWLNRLQSELGRLADPAQQGRLKLTFEIIYGHALRPERKLTVEPEMRLSVDELRSQLHRRRD